MRSPELQAVADELFRRRREQTRPSTLAERRATLDGIAKLFPVPDDVKLEEVEVGGVAAERLTPPGATQGRELVYLHGGAYRIGSPLSHRELAARVGRAAGACVLVPDYRLSPEHPFPAAVEDAAAVVRALAADGVRPALAGDSAGGGLAVAACLALREEHTPLPVALALLSPWVDLTCTCGSFTALADRDPILDPSLRDAAEGYLDGADPRTPLASPLFGGLSGLPPLLVQAGTAEILLDDATAFARAAGQAGVQVDLDIEEDLLHVWQMFPVAPEAATAVDRIGGFLSRYL